MKKNRTFKQGRGSEQLLNQELYDIFTAVKDINPDITEQEKLSVLVQFLTTIFMVLSGVKIELMN